jgi:hypothetical protein
MKKVQSPHVVMRPHHIPFYLSINQLIPNAGGDSHSQATIEGRADERHIDRPSS